MKEFQRQKREQVKLLKELQDSNHFNILSDEAKANVCSGFLLQKYLARELIENNPLRFQTNMAGDLVVDVNGLRQSEIFHEAIHLRDFVAAYVAHNPEKVKTPGYFKTLLNGVKDWKALLEYANAYFERINDNAFMEEGAVKASRQGCEIVKTWPENGMFLVRLHTLKALDYESDKMQHCVGKGGYDKKLLSGQTHIYSLRSESNDGEWLPHATIEYTENKIKQIRGYHNKFIEVEYCEFVREAIAYICGSNEFTELKKNGRFPDWRSLGYIEDETGKLHDVYNMREEAVFSCLTTDDLPQSEKALSLMTVKNLTIQGDDERLVARLKNLKAVGEIKDHEFYPKDYQELRNVMAEVFGSLTTEALSKRISGGILAAMGYVRELLEAEEHPKWKDIASSLFGPNQDEVLLDATHLDRVVQVQNLLVYGRLWQDMDWSHLICRKLMIGKRVSSEELQHISELAGCYSVNFDKTDFSQCDVIDLRGLTRMYERSSESHSKCAVWTAPGLFKEGMTIPHWVNGKSVIFDNCRHLPAGDKILFPSEIKHIMLDADPEIGDYIKQSLPDFNSYKQLESLQINDYDLAENEVLRLPVSLKYLAFYNCKFGKKQIMDLRYLKDLEVLRFCRSDLQEVDKFIFPENLKGFAVGGGKFKDGVSWDFSHCPRMNTVDFSCFGRVDSIAVEHISFPKAVEEIKLTSGNFPEMRKLDFSVYPNLKKLDLSFASFPNLEHMLLPENCILKQKGLKIPGNAVVEQRKYKEISDVCIRSAKEQVMNKLLLSGNRTADAH